MKLKMFASIMALLIFSGCSYLPWFSMVENSSTPTPTIAPTRVCPPPSLTLSASASSVHVGETLILTAQVNGVGMPLFELNLSSGGSARANYYDGSALQITNDDVFEIVSVEAGGISAQFTLRAKAAGSADATVGANGEAGCYDTGYYWGNAFSEPVHLEVTP